MSQKWNLQDIRPANQTKRRRRQPVSDPARQPAERVSEDIPSIVIEDSRNKSGKNIIIAVVLFLVITGGALILSGALGKTELTVYPEFRDPNISAEFTAFTNPTDSSLRYEVMTIEEISEAQVEATGQIEKQEQATGVIEIQKTTPGAERLRAQTRFRSPDGLVFRIPESVVVPGAITNESGELIPGTIQSDVFADDVGEEYNLAAGTTFDIPGFEEGGFTALFESITAVNTSQFTGGFDGPEFQIDSSELSTARQALQIELRNQLLTRIETEKPAGTIAFPGSVAITYNELPAVEYDNSLVTIREQATLQIPLFQSGELGTFLARESVATYEGGPVRIEDPTEILFTYSQATTSNSVIANLESLTFTLTGKPRLIWEYDSEELTENLAGLPKTAVKNAISMFPGIEGAKADITPFWQRTFPENPDEITVIEELRTETSE